jgi:hypothetical protein
MLGSQASGDNLRRVRDAHRNAGGCATGARGAPYGVPLLS